MCTARGSFGDGEDGKWAIDAILRELRSNWGQRGKHGNPRPKRTGNMLELQPGVEGVEK